MGATFMQRTVLGCLLLTTVVGCNKMAFSPSAVQSSNGGDITPVDPFMRLESFLFNTARPVTKVDVLFVIDNSRSMYEEQQKLAPRLASFVDSLAGVDWQIGITTTDLSDGPYGLKGRLVKFTGTTSHILTKNTPNYEQVFLATVTANGTPPGCDGVNTTLECPSGDEQPLEATRLAIVKRNTDNVGFFRSGADFAVIVLSDEDELSDGNLSYNPTTPAELLDTAVGVWGTSKSVSGFGIIIEPTDSACLSSQAATGGHPGTFVDELARQTGGVTGSICANDYSTSLASIGQRVKKLGTSIQLAEDPIVGSVIVKMTPADAAIVWDVTGRTVRFSDLPKPGTKVDVKYQVAPPAAL